MVDVTRGCSDCGKAVKRSLRCKGCSIRRTLALKWPPNRCKTCGKDTRQRVYCSWDCRWPPGSRQVKRPRRVRSIAKICPMCGKEFRVGLSLVNTIFRCSRACSRARGLDGTCERCGQEFRYSGTSPRRHCSDACRRPPCILNCENCGKGFRVTPSESKGRRYCSVRCYRGSDAETTIERIVREVLDDLLLAYEPQARVHRWVVDFVVDARIAIEADGDYWHAKRPSADRRKTAALKKRGYEVWRYPESAIMSPGFRVALSTRLTDFEATHGPLAQADLLQMARPPRRQTRTAAKPWPRPGLARGERSGRAKLTADDVVAIREAVGRETLTSLAKRYQVGVSTIGHIVTFRSWAHVGGPRLVRPTFPAVVPLQRSGRLTEVERQEIRASSARGKDLAELYGVSPQTISGVRRGHLWRSAKRSDPNGRQITPTASTACT